MWWKIARMKARNQVNEQTPIQTKSIFCQYPPMEKSAFCWCWMSGRTDEVHRELGKNHNSHVIVIDSLKFCVSSLTVVGESTLAMHISLSVPTKPKSKNPQTSWITWSVFSFSLWDRVAFDWFGVEAQNAQSFQTCVAIANARYVNAELGNN